MANPKCKWCGKEVKRKEAYKVVKNGKNNYFCSKEEYEMFERENSVKEMVEEQIISDLKITNYINKNKISKFILGLRDTYTYDDMLSYIRSGSNELEYAKNKNDYKNEFNKTAYFLVVVRNCIGDYVKEKSKQKETIIKTEFYMVPETYKIKKHRRAMSEIELLEDDDL